MSTTPQPDDVARVLGPLSGGVDLAALDAVLADVRVDAQRIDVDGVRRAQVDAIARAGFFALGAPAEHGGVGAKAPLVREAVERLAAASGALWFVAAQHRTALDALVSTTNAPLAQRWRADVVAGRALGAVGFAHLRRPGRPQVRATRTSTGWRMDGRLDWVTSWGLADVLVLMAETDDGRVVQAVVPAQDRVGMRVTGQLPLAAMSATSTVAMVLDALPVSDGEVATVIAKSDWVRHDAARTTNANPATFGLIRAVLHDLAGLGRRRGHVATQDAATDFAHEAAALRTAAYALMDDAEPQARLDDRLAVRAASLLLALRCTQARVAAEGGAAMLLSSPAQRWAREALFQLVQAQTGPLRNQLLAGLARE